LEEGIFVVKNVFSHSEKPVAHGLVLTLSILFAILYGIWLLPHTVFIRNFCLVVGAAISLYIIWPRRALLVERNALPIWLIFLLLLWVSAHLLFIGADFQNQLIEYGKVWKKITISVIFAIGLGMGLRSQAANAARTEKYWRIIYFGFLLPTIIYLFKCLVTTLGNRWEYSIPSYLIWSDDLHNTFGIHKVGYVFFCLPAFALGLGRIKALFLSGKARAVDYLIYLSVLPVILINFYIEDTRNGFAYAFILTFIAIVGVWLSKPQKFILRKIGLTIFLGAAFLYFASITMQQNSRWLAFFPDAQIALQVEKYDQWKFCGAIGHDYPINALGNQVAISNYERIAWAKVALDLIKKHPWGYGNLDLSFHHLGIQYWPEASCLHQSHSAWLDFALGYGIFGALILLLAAIFTWFSANRAPPPWSLIGKWGLGCTILILFTTEISNEIFINAFIFLIVLSSALSLPMNTREN
jgi:hypothetical protein